MAQEDRERNTTSIRVAARHHQGKRQGIVAAAGRGDRAQDTGRRRAAAGQRKPCPAATRHNARRGASGNTTAAGAAT